MFSFRWAWGTAEDVSDLPERTCGMCGGRFTWVWACKSACMKTDGRQNAKRIFYTLHRADGKRCDSTTRTLCYTIVMDILLNVTSVSIVKPASCQKGPSGICKKCRPRPAAASPTQRLIRVCTFWQSSYQWHLFVLLITYRGFQHRMSSYLDPHYLYCPRVPFRVICQNQPAIHSHSLYNWV